MSGRKIMTVVAVESDDEVSGDKTVNFQCEPLYAHQMPEADRLRVALGLRRFADWLEGPTPMGRVERLETLSGGEHG
jgi:hypothetical protein